MNMNPGFTPLQGRVLFHVERLCSRAGTPTHNAFIALAAGAGLPVAVDTYTDEQCRLALGFIEQAARQTGQAGLRDVRCS